MNELGVRPEETVMVGDSPVDVATGRAGGVFTVGVTYGLDPRSVVAARPDALLDDLRDLSALLADRDGAAAARP
jgi:phosphoglycolate phosphatase-like HAD superfamily hydrolase